MLASPKDMECEKLLDSAIGDAIGLQALWPPVSTTQGRKARFSKIRGLCPSREANSCLPRSTAERLCDQAITTRSHHSSNSKCITSEILPDHYTPSSELSCNEGDNTRSTDVTRRQQLSDQKHGLQHRQFSSNQSQRIFEHAQCVGTSIVGTRA